MKRSSLLQQAAATKQTLFDEGVLDDQFLQLEDIYGDPKSLEELITWSFGESAKNIGTIEQLLERASIDFIEVGKALHKLKGTSASIGAKNVLMKVNEMTEQCKTNTVDGCKASLQGLKNEQNDLKEKLTIYLQMKRQAQPGGAA
ncbi:histidine-containing phosphotransfer protein 4-like isoform X2 [Punica granatum]|uniref:Histidine-containing phosphotransfer protein n=2 Tax=Punica granatum TaxID=22663 RepID=A0A218W184_PUNGR|nr:histidine-containing phosphotransfer protein 4-like isoform X2 [Punica granatum]OWM66070.1 hypothetical protein CDL15_Pgr015497 [Punica granatum]PKI76239.1 hypothetical protein CRG98_003350 [Punica granatum]